MCFSTVIHDYTCLDLSDTVVVENHVLIGVKNAVLLRVTIGMGTIVVVGDVTTKDVLAYTVIGVVSAQVVQNESI